MQLTTMTPENVQEIHLASLRILAEVGIILDDAAARALMFSEGAYEKKGRVCLPPELVESCLARCPGPVTLQGRREAIVLGDGSLHIHNLGGARDVFDPKTGRLRPANLADVAESTRLLDALENVTSITPLYTPRDVPSHSMVLGMFDQTLRNTTKPVNGPGVCSATEVRLVAEMARVVLGDKPAVSLGASPVSPLNFHGEIAGSIMEIARQGLPFGPLPCPNVGATSPMSLAGSLALQNAEVLACIVLAQLVQPGLPVVYCGRLSVINMRSGAPIWGNPEVGIASAGTVQVGHSYGLPVNVYGLADSSYGIDIQSGYERAINALTPALAGADELSGVGEMAGGVYSCNAQIVIDNDIYGMVQRVRRGFIVDQDSLAVEVIQKVMDDTRSFMGEQHTRKYLRSGELWFGRLGVAESSWESWFSNEMPTALDRAEAEVEKILNSHSVEPITEDQDRELKSILQFAKEILD